MVLPVLNNQEIQQILHTPIRTMEDCLRFCEFLKLIIVRFWGQSFQQEISAWIQQTHLQLIKDYREIMRQ
jgi:hypothetical protein